MSFYGEMPDQYNVVINGNHPLVLRINEEKDQAYRQEIDKINEKLKPLNDNKAELDKANKDKKEEEIAQADKDRIAELEKKISEFEGKRTDTLKKFGSENKIVKQLVDIALLSNNMLKGEDLNKFVKRSIELL
jgi:molecular chaperone HtpG